jgi:glycine betaine/proline transport system ATP-binding protein
MEDIRSNGRGAGDGAAGDLVRLRSSSALLRHCRKDASFSVGKGEIFCSWGSPGGKSTLIRHINRLIEPTDGGFSSTASISASSRPRAARRLRAERMGMVFQNVALLPYRRCSIMRLRPRDGEVHECPAAARHALEIVQWRNGKGASRSSGGLQQRVGLARALAST